MTEPIDPVVQHVYIEARRPDNDEVTLVINGQVYGGWEEVRITRGVERLPSDFELRLTDIYADEPDVLQIHPGDTCVVRIGVDRVITGYVDIVSPQISGNGHAISVYGRGKCQDLVDCAAEWPKNEISGATVLDVAQKLAQPYGIEVTTLDDPGEPIPQFNLMRGETVFEIVERICRFRQLLAYDGADGNLILSKGSTEKAASGFKEGFNVQAASLVLSQAERFSLYKCYAQSLEVLKEAGVEKDLIVSVPDSGVKRYRLRIVVAESSGKGFDYSNFYTDRMNWEAARRLGRAYALRLTTDSWRDKSGALYEPNTLVPLELPSLKLDKIWAISEVTFRKSEQGTACDLVIMPPIAFQQQPTLITQLPAEVQNAPAGAGAPPGAPQ